MLKEKVAVIIEESNKEEIEGLSINVQICKTNSNEVSANETFSWVLNVRVFKSRARKSECQDMINMLNAIVN